MSPRECIEEAHGLWELSIQRVAALAEAVHAELTSSGQPGKVLIDLLADAIKQERAAYHYWCSVSDKAIEDTDATR